MGEAGRLVPVDTITPPGQEVLISNSHAPLPTPPSSRAFCPSSGSLAGDISMGKTTRWAARARGQHRHAYASLHASPSLFHQEDRDKGTHT